MINEEEEKITINKRELEQIINNAITHQIEFIISELKRNFEKRLELFTQFTLQQLTEIYSLFSNVINSYKVIPENRGSFLKMSCCSNCKAIFQRINGYLCNRCDHFEICHSCFIQFKLNPNFHEMILLIKPQFEAGKEKVEKGACYRAFCGSGSSNCRRRSRLFRLP